MDRDCDAAALRANDPGERVDLDPDTPEVAAAAPPSAPQTEVHRHAPAEGAPELGAVEAEEQVEDVREA